jgi:hypothetical protein
LSADKQESDPVFVYENVTGSFYVENIGTDTFRIANVKSTCACTTAVQTKGAVAPGERAEIKYDMNSAAPRQRSVALLVQTNPPLAEPLRFTAAGTWKPVIETNADGLGFEANFGEPFEQTIALRPAPGAGPIRVTGVKTRQSWIELSLLDAEDGALPKLVVRSKDVVQPGTHKLGIALEFEREVSGRQDITLELNVLSEFEIEPSPLIVDLASKEAMPTVELTIRNKKDKAFVPQSIRGERLQFDLPKMPATPAAVHVIPITFNLQAGPTPRRGRLTVDLGEGNGVFSVDVFFSERPVHP